VKTKNGKCVTTSEGQLKRWREIFKEILNSNCPPYEEEEGDAFSPPTTSIRTPSKREVIYALKSMKNRKAAGSNNIPAKILKLDSSKAADMLLLFQEIWHREKFLKE
jgi:hypothetical protein